MKNYLLLLLLVFLSKANIAQQWLQYLPNSRSGEYTLHDYQKAYNTFCEKNGISNGEYRAKNGEIKPVYGWKQFKRWEHMMELRANPTTGKLPDYNSVERGRQYRSSSNSRAVISNIGWSQQGPNNFTSNGAVIGRLNCVTFHPTDPMTYWVGSAGGGLWVTKDDGASWRPLTDNLNSLGISDIAVADASTIYIATGDREVQFLNEETSNRSIGVYKSTNGGASWDTTGSLDKLEKTNNLKINKLQINGTDKNKILAATNMGLFSSVDAGKKWNKVSDLAFRDLELNANNLLFGSTNTDIRWSSDFGKTWNVAKIDTATSLPSVRIELAITPKSASVVYALAADGLSGLLGVYKSTDSGKNYTAVYSSASKDFRNLICRSNEGKPEEKELFQGWYDLALAVSNTDVNTIYLGGVNTWTSKDGGVSWDLFNHWTGNGAPEIHADKHMLKFRSNGDLFECNDGGLFVFQSKGGWVNKSAGLVISQAYNIGVFQGSPVTTLMGLQDNGIKKMGSDKVWSQLSGGDGTECFFDQTDEKVKYISLQKGVLRRLDPSFGMDVNWINDISPKGKKGKGDWVTPFIMDANKNGTLYCGYDEIYKSTDKGANWTTITNRQDTFNVFRLLALAPSNSKVLYAVGARNGQYILSTNDNTAKSPVWNNITAGINTGAGTITDIEVKSNDPNTVWVTLGGFGTNHVYETKDGGKKWADITGNLPAVPVYTITQNKQAPYEDQLYIGTEYGVFFKNGSDDWEQINYKLPNVPVQDLEIYYDKDPSKSLLKAGTFGRGLWQTSMAPVCRSPFINGNNAVCQSLSTKLTATIAGGSWKSNTTTIATIAGDGTVKGIKPGTTTISYTLARTGCVTETANKYFTVGEPIKNVTITGNELVMAESSIDWNVSNTMGSWSSDNSGVATARMTSIFGGFIKYGTITGVNVGKTTITYTVPVVNGCPGMTVRKPITVMRKVDLYQSEANGTQTGIEEAGLKKADGIYPNPSTGTVYIDNTDGLAKSVKIVGLSGKEIANRPLVNGSNSIDLNDIESGVYIVMITGDGFTKMSRLVITK